MKYREFTGARGLFHRHPQQPHTANSQAPARHGNSHARNDEADGDRTLPSPSDDEDDLSLDVHAVNRELRRCDRERQSQPQVQTDNDAGANAGEPGPNQPGSGDDDNNNNMDEDYDPNTAGQQVDDGDESEEDDGVVSKVIKRVVKKTPQGK